MDMKFLILVIPKLTVLYMQYYLKTGNCKFGPSCKFHHPREKAGTAWRAQLNALNLPLRPVKTMEDYMHDMIQNIVCDRNVFWRLSKE